LIGNLFKPKTFLEADLEGWSLETWAWLMRNMGGMQRLSTMPLATPSRDFFPPSDATGHARAVHVLECVKAVMGMQNWPCELQPFDRRDAQQVSEFVVVAGSRKPLGTFEYNAQGDVLIRYGATLVDQPGVLVATLAHELSHYLVSRVEEPLPGGAEANELVTELCVAYSGFGLFAIANAMAFRGFRDTFAQGWQITGAGYLSQRTWAFSLAIFLALKNEDVAVVDRWLTHDLAKLTRKAVRHLAERPDKLEPLRDIT